MDYSNLRTIRVEPTTGANKSRIGVLGSCKGSNFVAIADACAAGVNPAEIALVLNDVESAKILQHARDRNIPAKFIAPGGFRTKLDDAAERGCVESLQAAKVDLIALAGFMRVLKGQFGLVPGPTRPLHG